MDYSVLYASVALCGLTACTAAISDEPSGTSSTPAGVTPDGAAPASTVCDDAHRLKPRLVRLASADLRAHVRRALPGTSETALEKLNLQADHLARLSERAISSAELGAYFDGAREVAQGYVQGASEALSCREAGAEEGCLQAVLRAAVDRLYRTPVNPEEWLSIEASFRKLVPTHGVAEAAAGVLAAALISPRTLYQTERSAAGAPTSGVYDLARADALIQARLALTGQAPEASELAAIDSLDSAAFRQQLAERARTWVQTPEFQARALDFVKHRFGVDLLEEVDRLDPLYTTEVRVALNAELAAHVSSTLLSPSGSFEQLFATTPTSVFPGLEGIYAGDAALGGMPRRKGILGLPGLLAAHAGPAGSDPVKRGIMVRVELLCEAMPPPIPDADFGKVTVTEEMTTRERFEALAALPACTSCHLLINPPGYLFEEFDQLGRYRSQEKGKPINAVGTIPPFFGSEPYPGVASWDGIVPLAEWLARSPHARTCFATHFASWLLAEGVPLGIDNCGLPTIAQSFTQSGRLDDLAAALVSSDLFLSRAREAL